MTQPHGDSHGYAGFPHHEEHDNWPDAPADRLDPLDDGGTDDGGTDELDDLDHRYLQTLGTPSYDLGPTTGSFIVDLTSPVPVAPRPSDNGLSATAYPTDQSDEALRSRHAAPPELSALPTEPHPAATTPPAPAYAEPTQPATPQPAAVQTASPPTAAPDWGIPPVPKGPALSGAESLTAATVLRTSRPRPQSGWRKGVFAMTGGRVNLGQSPADVRRADLVTRARTPVSGCHRLAVISLKGGVGKTTTTAALGAMFADLRGDRVIAVDANPDRGTLAERVPRENGATVRHLLDSRDLLHRYADVREFTSQSPTRLEVLASDSDPRVSAALSEQDYRDTITTLERFYNLVLTDCGTGLLHDAMRGILGLASSLVVVSSASLDGARSASATLDWLEAHGFDHLAKNAVVVISSVRPGGGIVDVAQLEEHFASRCRDVVTIPYDPHLEAGGVLDLADLDVGTLDAYRTLAAAVGEAFAGRR
ncbi:MAG: nucleotide-binding protein [Actinomycetes bacterium]